MLTTINCDIINFKHIPVGDNCLFFNGGVICYCAVGLVLYLHYSDWQLSNCLCLT